jgi:hypothetical protein
MVFRLLKGLNWQPEVAGRKGLQAPPSPSPTTLRNREAGMLEVSDVISRT